MNRTCEHGFRMTECPNADCFAKAGGEHSAAYEPFDGALVTETRRVAIAIEDATKVLQGIHLCARALVTFVRGRDDEGKRVPSTLSAIADSLVGIAKRAPEQPQTGAPQTQRTPQSPQSGGKRVATDAEMSGDKGDPKVRFDPKKDWTDKGKPSFKGQNFSACDPDFLDVYAAALDYFASESQKKVDAGTADDRAKSDAKYGPLDAARARGWAARTRSKGYQPPPPPPADDYD